MNQAITSEYPLNDDDLPDGNFIVSPSTRNQFANNLHKTIAAQLFSNNEEMHKIIHKRRVVFKLPKKEQLLDFVAITIIDGITADTRAMSIVLQIPSSKPKPDGTYDYYMEEFDYCPPKLPDYLDLYSKN